MNASRGLVGAAAPMIAVTPRGGRVAGEAPRASRRQPRGRRTSSTDSGPGAGERLVARHDRDNRAPVRVRSRPVSDRASRLGRGIGRMRDPVDATPSSRCTLVTASLTGLPPSSSAKVRASSPLRCRTVLQASGSDRSYTASSRRPVRCDNNCKTLLARAHDELVPHANTGQLSLGHLGHQRSPHTSSSTNTIGDRRDGD